jgi:Fe(3+) dicitrate transport protein
VSPGQAPEVEPETSVNYEAGTRIQYEKTRVELIGFFNDYSNLTGECTFSSGCPDDLINAQFNGGDVFVYGLEASAGQGIDGPFSSKLKLDLTYTLTLSEFRSTFASDNPQFGRVDIGDELPYLPEHQAALIAELRVGDFSLGAKLAYVHEMRNIAGQGEIAPIDRIPPHLVLDAAASYIIGGSEIYLRGDNLTNTAYIASRRPFGARPGRPLLVFLGYKYRFGP